MNKTALLFTLLIVWFSPLIALAQGYALFPQEKYTDLVVIATDQAASSFIVKNAQGEQMQGHVGDFLGAEEAEVVSLTAKDMTLETIEYIEDAYGNEHEQRSRMELPLSFSYYGKGKGTKKK